MNNSLEPQKSIALDHLESFVDPSNFLVWRAEWDKDCPQGFRIVFNLNHDGHSVEEDIATAMSDFLSKVRHLCSNVKDEIRKVKVSQLNVNTGAWGAEQQYGLRLRSMLDKVLVSQVMPKYEGPIEKIFQELEESVREDLRLDIIFTLAVGESIVDEAIQKEKSKKPDEGLGDKLESNKKNTVATTQVIKVKDERNFKCKKDPLEVVPRWLAFLNHTVNAYSDLSDSEHSELIQIINQMFFKQEQVDGDRNFAHTINTEITEKRILTAFGNIIEELLEEKRPKWYIPSIKILFDLKGEILNIDRKLKDDVVINRPKKTKS